MGITLAVQDVWTIQLDATIPGVSFPLTIVHQCHRQDLME